MWFVLALGTAVFWTAQSAASKRVSENIHADIVTWAAFFFAYPLYVCFLLANGIPEVKPEFWLFTLASVATNLLALPMLFRSLQVGELSIVLPLATLTPMFALGTEYFMLGVVPTGQSVLGVALIVFGAYALNAGDIRKGLFAPFKMLVRDRGARLMMGASALWAVGAVADRGAVMAASPGFYLVSFCTIFMTVFFIWVRHTQPADLRLFHKRPLKFVWVGVFGAGMATCQMLALNLATAAEVTSVKRISALLGVLTGGLMFKEAGYKPRIFAACLMVIGAAVLAVQ